MAGLHRGEDYTKGFLLYARVPIAKGQQVYISYGTKTNEELLRTYGFVQPNNADKLRTQFKLAINSAGDPLAAQKKELLKHTDIQFGKLTADDEPDVSAHLLA